MPKLPQFDAGNVALQPTERGVDARLQEARRTSGFYNEAAGMITAGAQSRVSAQNDVDRSFANDAEALGTFAKQQEDFAGHREVSAGAAAGAKLFDKLNDDWNNTVKNADPNDPSVAAKFRETVLEPSLQQFNEAYSNTDRGRQWSEQHVESMRNHFFQKTASDMSTLAGDAVKVNAKNLANSASNAAFKSPDFHTVDYLLSKTENDVSEIVGSSPNVKGADSSRLRTTLAETTKEQIVKSAASGAIAKSADPEKTAADFASRYPQYINGADEAAQARAAKVQAKANTLTDKQIETYQRQQDDRGVHIGLAKVMTDNVSFDENGKAIVKPEAARQALDVARQYPNAPSAASAVHSTISWLEHQQNQRAQPTVSDPAVKRDLLDGMFRIDKPTTLIDLQKANVDNKLSTHDYAAMHGLLTSLEEAPLKNPIVHETLNAAKHLLGTDPVGTGKYASFVQDFIPQYLSLKKQNALPPNALDLKDPKSLISQSMSQYQRPAIDIMRDRIMRGDMPSANLTAPGTTITGTQTINQPVGEKTFVPPANWQYSESRKQYRDQNGKLYDASGKPVK